MKDCHFQPVLSTKFHKNFTKKSQFLEHHRIGGLTGEFVRRQVLPHQRQERFCNRPRTGCPPVWHGPAISATSSGFGDALGERRDFLRLKSCNQRKQNWAGWEGARNPKSVATARCAVLVAERSVRRRNKCCPASYFA